MVLAETRSELRGAEGWVYSFKDGNGTRKLLGGKGAGLAEMIRLGLPVPPGFTITTEACNRFLKNEKQFPIGMWEQTLQALKELEATTGKKLGDSNNPLLVSVRSGAKISMPGMMDTVLNLGINDETVIGLANKTGSERSSQDAYRRFIQMYGSIVMGINGKMFEEKLSEIKKKKSVSEDTKLDAEDLKQVVSVFKKIVKSETGKDLPSDPMDQLRLAVSAVFTSWSGDRAVVYRNRYKIPHDLGTAVTVQSMVFGNMGEDSGTGVAFTRNPATGEKVLYGEYLGNAQGEDVVAGIRTPTPIVKLKEVLPDVAKQLGEIAEILEDHYRDVQDIEFTVEKGKLYILQTRNAQRTGEAAAKIALDMVDKGKISQDEAIMRIQPDHVVQLLLPFFDPKAKEDAIAQGKLLTKGVPASPGAAYGKVVFDADRASELGNKGEKIILVRPGTAPEDLHGIIAAQGLLTSRGGITSHAAVVARGMGKPTVVGTESIEIDLKKREMKVGGLIIPEGEGISIDGATGEVFIGEINAIGPSVQDNRELSKILEWADERSRLAVWANADNPKDAKKSLEFGAKGIGLCRTEHMFMEKDRLPIVQRMILAAPEAIKGDGKAKEEFDSALSQLLPIQREDFKGILRAMNGLPVVIRLLDPPLNEFLPDKDELLVDVTRMEEGNEVFSAELDSKKQLLAAVEALTETNPMMGLRGCRLGIAFPGINEMQVRAIFEAACELKREGLSPRPKIMIPLVAYTSELVRMKDLVEKTGKKVMQEQNIEVDYKFGTMIEVPRAALIADKIAEIAEFFSFGTNDLTQMTHGISRDDAEAGFLGKYVKDEILSESPFQSIDEEGVGQLVIMAVEKGRSEKPDLEIGVCGEHGGDPKSIEFFNEAGLDYVSASPFRVPVARLAAAQAQIRKNLSSSGPTVLFTNN